MKTSIVRQCSLAVAVGLAFFLGCARPSAQTEQAKPIVSPANPPVVAAPAAPGAPDPTAPKADADTNAPAILERIPPTTTAENVATTSGIAEVAKLAQAGVTEQVILAYVEKYNGRFEVGADQIVYLNDLGVSSTVITAMLKHDGGKAPATTASAPPPETNTTPVAPAKPTATVSAAPPPTASTEVSYFYDSLSPYGSWIYVSGYGWCWQPTVAVSVSTWRPYCDNGSWYWSDGGWYWHSDYSWGWAPFHYGRWYHHGRVGWVWTPGTVWGPSWVSWRYYNGYCGWAPLPPQAHYAHGVGFTYYGSHVSVGFEFGLTAFHYSFVHVNRFCDPAPYRHVIARPTVVNIYNNTTVVNNYGSGNNRTVINRGFGRETVARSSGGRVREVAIRETPMNQFNPRQGQRIERQGRELVAYRPQLPQTPPTVRTAPTSGRSRTGDTVSGGRAVGGGSGPVTPDTTPRSRPAVGNRNGDTVNGGRAVGGGSGAVTPVTPTTTPRSGSGAGGRTGTEVTRGNPTTGTAPANQGRSEPGRPAPRQDNSLFGNSGTERAVPRNNNTPTAPTTPRGQPQNPTGPANVTPRSNPQPRPATPNQVAPRPQQPNNSVPTRVAPNNVYGTPRQYEQAPRRIDAAPANPAPAARPAPSAPSRQERSVPSGGGNSGSGQGGRGERNR